VQRIIQAYDRHDAARRAAAGEMPAAPPRGSDDDDAEVPDERRPS
jgi:hypothetical protein